MTIGSRFYLPYATAEDGTGVPIPGAQLFFYASGTNTQLNTYADSALTTPNANPVVANQFGMFPSIFLGPLAYKAVLTDASLNQIWTADPVASAVQSGGGNWTPIDSSGAGLALTINRAIYRTFGDLVMIQVNVTYPVTANGANASWAGLPIPVPLNGSGTGWVSNGNSAQTRSNSSNIDFFTSAGAPQINSNLSGGNCIFSLVYSAT